MAVQDKYTDSNVAAQKKTHSFLTGVGNKIFYAAGQASIAAADDDGSVYRILKDVPANYVPVRIAITNTAITNGTDYDIGIYDRDLGAVKERDIFLDGASMASARTVRTDVTSLTAAVEADFGKSVGELSTATTVALAYDIALTANTVGTVAGTVTVHCWFVQR